MYDIVFEGYGDHRDPHILTHSFPTRRSSDLRAAQSGGDALIAGDEFGQVLADQLADVRRSRRCGVERLQLRCEQVELDADAVDELARGGGKRRALRLEPDFGAARELLRSEEHTSELQSLMRISYAVFCLKK